MESPHPPFDVVRPDVKGGQDCRAFMKVTADLAAQPPDDDHPDLVADHPHHDHTHPGERIDYLWLAQPTTGRQVTADRPRRWGFPRPGVHGGLAGTLSDHLALSVTLHLD